MLSKVVTIRDRQLEENKILEREYREEQKKLDTMMEIERLKAVQAEQDRELRRKEARRRGAQVIVDQIADRGKDRIREYEKTAIEMAIMRKHQQTMVQEEEKKTDGDKMNEEEY